jgi:hypothetical protein
MSTANPLKLGMSTAKVRYLGATTMTERVAIGKIGAAGVVAGGPVAFSAACRTPSSQGTLGFCDVGNEDSGLFDLVKDEFGEIGAAGNALAVMVGVALRRRLHYVRSLFEYSIL